MRARGLHTRTHQLRVASVVFVCAFLCSSARPRAHVTRNDVSGPILIRLGQLKSCPRGRLARQRPRQRREGEGHHRHESRRHFCFIVPHHARRAHGTARYCLGPDGSHSSALIVRSSTSVRRGLAGAWLETWTLTRAVHRTSYRLSLGRFCEPWQPRQPRQWEHTSLVSCMRLGVCLRHLRLREQRLLCRCGQRVQARRADGLEVPVVVLGRVSQSLRCVRARRQRWVNQASKGGRGTGCMHDVKQPYINKLTQTHRLTIAILKS